MRKRFLFILFLIFITFSFVFIYKNGTEKGENSVHSSVVPPLSPDEYAAARKKYTDSITQHNPREALDQLRTDIKTNGSLLRSCHTLTHELGYAAYEKYQDFGGTLKYQDEICNSGYLHGIIEAYFNKSDDIFHAMQIVCSKYSVKTYLGWECYHGVGHGLMYSTLNNLPLSIKYCETYTDKSEAASCANGAYMENFNTDQKLHTSVFLKADDPFYPCKNQPKELKEYCYLYTPVYFLSLHNNDYAAALAWCKTAEKDFKNGCTQGVGVQAMKDNMYNPKFVEETCMRADKSQHFSCIAGMVDLYIVHLGSTTQASALCGKLQKSNQSLCYEVTATRARQFGI